MNYHSRIMNMPRHFAGDAASVERDTRHLAAEIAVQADAEIATLRAALDGAEAFIEKYTSIPMARCECAECTDRQAILARIAALKEGKP